MRSRHWSISEKDLADMLQANHIIAATGTPLEGIAALKRDTDSVNISKTVEPRLLRAIEWVAQPRLELDLLLGPSNNGGIVRFFRGKRAKSNALAGHRRDSKGDHLFACTSEQELMPNISTCLALDIPIDAGNISLDLTATAYQTFLGVIDYNRELTLKSLLEHKPAQGQSVTSRGILDAFERSASSKDFRWLAGLAKAVSPFEFELDNTQCEQGLRELTNQGLLEHKEKGWSLSQEMQALCATLASPLAYCVVYRRHQVGNQQWNRQHLMILRGMGSLWLFRFEELDLPSPRIHIRDASREEVELAISEQFQEWEIPQTVAGTVAAAPEVSSKEAASPFEIVQKPEKAVPGPGQMLCPSCGGLLKEGAKFCGFCRTPLLNETPVSPPQVCPQCNNPLKPGKRFCGRCGFKLS